MALDLLSTLYGSSLQFANQAGLYALLSIIPLIIIYLLRPRPLKVKIPSLMFLMDIEKKKRLNIFRKFLKDPLFLMQLFVLILTSLAVAAPFIMANEEAGGGSTVIILDASASMQAKTTLGDTKFESAVGQADKYLGSKNTIILAESVPVMVIKETSSGSASDALSKLKPKATSTDLSGAILLGRRLLPEGGRIVVFSDFTSWNGDDPNIAREVAQANGIIVDFVTVSGRTDNVGIIDGWFEGSDYKLVIRNFNKEAQNVKIDVATNSSTLSLDSQSNGYFTVSKLSPGTTKISLNVDDALSVDNDAYVIIPKAIERNILYITDNAKSPSLVALNLIPYTTVKTVDTKSIPSLSGYSIVFVNSPLSSDAAKSLSDYVKGGGNAVIIASPGLQDMDLLPVVLDSVTNKTSLNVAQASGMTDGISIDKVDVKKHFKATLRNGAVALVKGGDESAMLAYWKFGSGTVIYSGLADPQGNNIFDPLNENVWNDFHALPEYPLFWKQVIEWVSGSLDVSEFNGKTGQFIKLPASQTVKTPTNSITTDLLLLDEVGIYGLPDKDVAVNLYNEQESNLAGSTISASAGAAGAVKEVSVTSQTIRAPKYLDVYLIIAAISLVFLELYYLRWRGEL